LGLVNHGWSTADAQTTANNPYLFFFVQRNLNLLRLTSLPPSLSWCWSTPWASSIRTLSYPPPLSFVYGLYGAKSALGIMLALFYHPHYLSSAAQYISDALCSCWD